MTTVQDRPASGGQALAQMPAERRDSVWRRFRRASPFALIYSAAILIFYTIIFIIPFGTGIWLAFQNWDFITNPQIRGPAQLHQGLYRPVFLASPRKNIAVLGRRNQPSG